MNLPPYGDQFRRVNSFFSTLKVLATPDPSMKVEVTAGGFWLNSKKYIEYKGGVSPDIVPPTVNSKWILVTVNYNGQIKIVDGDQSSHPIFPDCPADSFPLSAIYLNRLDTKITSDKIFDIRGIFNSTSTKHSDLSDRNNAESHEISAINGLDERLNDCPTFDDIRSVLIEKADTNGTTSSTFTLNKDQVGSPISDATVEVNRGDSPTVFFRWNEGLRCWEYTNDGETVVQLTNVGPTILFPPATSTTLGGIKVGNYLTVTIDGTLNSFKQTDENYSTTEKIKLTSIEDNANRYIHPVSHPARMIVQEFGLRFMTDAEKAKLSGIEDIANHYVHPSTHLPEVILQDSTHRFMTDMEKSKLNQIEDNANRYLHPNTHPASMITEDPNKRFISETELVKLAGIEENSNNFVHPAFHPATMITMDDTHQFITNIERSTWTNKVDSTYVDTKISDLIGTAPSTLDTLKELADAIADDSNFAANMTVELNKKVDKSVGMGLSQSNYTVQEKNKLSTIQDFANNYVHAATHPASMIVEDVSRRFVADLEKNKLANCPPDTITALATKVDKDGTKILSEQNYSLAEKNKLANIADGANNYVHPVSHVATVVTQDTTHRFVTDLQITNWDGKDSFTPADIAHWNGSPVIIQDAINRIAAVLFTLNGNVAI